MNKLHKQLYEGVISSKAKELENELDNLFKNNGISESDYIVVKHKLDYVDEDVRTLIESTDAESQKICKSRIVDNLLRVQFYFTLGKEENKLKLISNLSRYGLAIKELF